MSERSLKVRTRRPPTPTTSLPCRTVAFMLLYEGCDVSSRSRGSGSVAVPWPAAASIWIEGFPGCKDLAGLHFLLPFSFLLSRPHPLFLITDGKKKKQSFSEQRCQHFEIITRELLPLLGLVAAPNCPVLGWIAGVPYALLLNSKPDLCRKLLRSSKSGSGCTLHSMSVQKRFKLGFSLYPMRSEGI